jgi:hypothetical protein
MIDMEEMEFCFGIQLKMNPQLHIVELNQSEYVNDVLRKYDMENCKPIFNPLESILKLIQVQFISLKEKM